MEPKLRPICQECSKDFDSINSLYDHQLQEHSIYKSGKPILTSTENSFDKAKEIVKWLFLNRKGCTGSYQLTNEWYRADFLGIQKYDSVAKGFIQTKPITFDIILPSFSPDTIVRAGQKIQEDAYKRIMDALKKEEQPNKEDVALLPTSATQLKRRRREGAMTLILGKK